MKTNPWVRCTPKRSSSLVLMSWLMLATTCVAEVSEAAVADSSVVAVFEDPLDHPAKVQSHLQERPLMAISAAGDRLVAVGMRGLIVISDDHGGQWRQARVPVQSDLLAVMFPSPLNGWAVGHDGTILHTRDAGDTWEVQLDGRKAEQQFIPVYQVRADQGDTAAQAIVDSLKVNFRSGPSLPYLSVWFENDLVGYAVGSFGSIVATVDGGKTWQPWYDHIDNAEGLNLNGIYGVNHELFIVGEQGHVFRLDRDAKRFRSILTGYEGSFFSVLGNGRVLLAFGLRGKYYKSDDQGVTWKAEVLPTPSTVASGAPLANDGGFVLVNAAGQLLITDSTANQVQVSPARKAMRLTAVAPLLDQKVVVTGLRGVALEPLPVQSSR